MRKSVLRSFCREIAEGVFPPLLPAQESAEAEKRQAESPVFQDQIHARLKTGTLDDQPAMERIDTREPLDLRNVIPELRDGTIDFQFDPQIDRAPAFRATTYPWSRRRCRARSAS